MSADAWETCPICHNRPEEYPDGIEHLYGKISLDEFLKLKAEIEQLEAEETVREDYEVGLADDGTAWVYLRLKCQTCGTTWKFKKSNITRD